MNAEQMLDGINRRHGLSLVPRRRFPTGLQGGAWLVVDPAGGPAVLKWWPGRSRDLTATIDRLRARGYPTPRWLAEGSSGEFAYCVQEFASGRPASPITAATVGGILRTLDRHEGLAPPNGRDWNTEVAEMAHLGRNVTGRYTRLLAVFEGVELPAGDLVHGDFNSINILLAGGRVSGIIDVDNLGHGSRVIDYACLLRESYVEGYGPAVTEPILNAGLKVAGPGPLAIAATAAAYFIVGFKQKHEPHRMPEILDRLDRMAEDIGLRASRPG
jgi:hypothetical protein